MRDGWKVDDHCFMAFMLSLSASGTRFDAFLMDVGSGQGIPVDRYDTEYNKAITCKAGLAHFEIQEVVLNVKGKKHDQPAPSVVLPMMETLHIHTLCVMRLVSCEGLAKCASLMQCTFSSMQSLHLEKLLFDWWELIPFLNRQKRLRVLHICNGSVFGVPKQLAKSRNDVPNDIVCEELKRLTAIPCITESHNNFAERSYAERW
jgi:hypothetical protein